MKSELLPNPDRCTLFEPNPFKREKCRQCGHGWQQHKGIISDELIAGYVRERQDSIDAQEKVEADAKAKARARDQAKKKASQAVEDGWLHDDCADDGQSDEDDDMGFQMFSASNLDSAPIESASRRESMAQSNKPLKVVNLIDLSECDVPVEEPSAAMFSAGANMPLLDASGLARATSPIVEDDQFRQPSHGKSLLANEVACAHSSNEFLAPVSNEAALLAEIEHLRQMLADTSEEKNIQVAVFRDQLDEKERLIDELRRPRLASPSSTRSGAESLDSLQTDKAQSPPQQSPDASIAHDPATRCPATVGANRILNGEAHLLGSDHILSQELEDAVFAREMDVVERERLISEAELSRNSGGLARLFCRAAVRCMKPRSEPKFLT